MTQDFEGILAHIHKKETVGIYPSFGEIKIKWFNHLIQKSRLNNKPNNLTILLDKAEKEPKAITSFLHSNMNNTTKDQILTFWEKCFPKKCYKKCYKKCSNDDNTYIFVPDQAIELSLD